MSRTNPKRVIRAGELEVARGLICSLHNQIREVLIGARPKGAALARVAAVTESDTIYRIDRISEEAILAWFDSHWPAVWPVELVMEGLDEGEAVFPRGTPRERTILKCIIDPIDGTRNLMYDKRSAWILTGLALQRGPATSLEDILLSVMTELPTSKQWRADQVSAVRGKGTRGLVCVAHDVRGGGVEPIRLSPSKASDFHHGFASFVRFFPEGKALTAAIEEALWGKLVGLGRSASPTVFDDQYLTTGGQIYELLCGHDRMIGDLRPRVLAHLGFDSSLVCHPYDICTALILEEAGGVVEDPFGGPLRAPLDTTSPVAWIGYANPRLASQVRPHLRRILKRVLG